MDPQIVTWILFGLLVLALFASYLKSKKSGDDKLDGDHGSSTVRSQMDEVFDYFGVKSDRSTKLARSLDLAPVSMLAQEAESRKGSKPGKDGGDQQRDA